MKAKIWVLCTVLNDENAPAKQCLSCLQMNWKHKRNTIK